MSPFSGSVRYWCPMNVFTQFLNELSKSVVVIRCLLYCFLCLYLQECLLAVFFYIISATNTSTHHQHFGAFIMPWWPEPQRQYGSHRVCVCVSIRSSFLIVSTQRLKSAEKCKCKYKAIIPRILIC